MSQSLIRFIKFYLSYQLWKYGKIWRKNYQHWIIIFLRQTMINKINFHFFFIYTFIIQFDMQ